MLKKYLMDTGGNVAMMFAVSVTALLVCAGAALDYTGMTRQSTELQNYVDMAVLAAAASGENDIGKLEKIAEASLQFHNTENLPINAKIIVNKEEVRIIATVEYDTVLMGVVGKDKMPLSVKSASPLSTQSKINLSLVLDTTGSMAGSNMQALITASEDLLEVLDKSGDKAEVALVPFGQYVNVGLNNKNESWLDRSKDGTSYEEEVCWTHSEWEEMPVCTETGRTITTPTYSDGVQTGERSYQETTCTDGKKSLEEQRCEIRTIEFEWHGCVDSRVSPLNAQAEFGVVRIPAHYNQPDRCGAPVMTLTNDLDRVETAIKNLEARGDTYLPSGLIWGWRTLQNQQPFKNDRSGKDAMNAILFMTDGANTKSVSSDGTHNGTDAGAGLDLTKKLCDAIKNDGIQIYTVGYRLPGGSEETADVLKYCASTPGQSFNPSNPGQLKKNFKQIAHSLKVTRLKY